MTPATARRVTLPASITTPRLLLRPWRTTDAPLLKAAIEANLDHLRTWMDWANKEPSSLKAIEQRIERFDRAFRGGSEWLYAIFSHGEGALYGGAGLHPRIGRGGLEIGYWLQKAWMKQGYATEAVKALTDVAFTLPDTQIAQIRCDPRNTLSAAVAQRAGFRHVRTLPKDAQDPKGAPRETMVWELARPGSEKAVELSPSRGRSGRAAALSLVVPGLGQLAQRRFIAGAFQLTTAAAYVYAALTMGWGRAVFLAGAWNLWSAVDAYFHRLADD